MQSFWDGFEKRAKMYTAVKPDKEEWALGLMSPAEKEKYESLYAGKGIHAKTLTRGPYGGFSYVRTPEAKKYLKSLKKTLKSREK